MRAVCVCERTTGTRQAGAWGGRPNERASDRAPPPPPPLLLLAPSLHSHTLSFGRVPADVPPTLSIPPAHYPRTPCRPLCWAALSAWAAPGWPCRREPPRARVRFVFFAPRFLWRRARPSQLGGAAARAQPLCRAPATGQRHLRPSPPIRQPSPRGWLGRGDSRVSKRGLLPPRCAVSPLALALPSRRTTLSRCHASLSSPSPPSTGPSSLVVEAGRTTRRERVQGRHKRVRNKVRERMERGGGAAKGESRVEGRRRNRRPPAAAARAPRSPSRAPTPPLTIRSPTPSPLILRSPATRNGPVWPCFGRTTTSTPR